MSTHNICFCREIRKILWGYPLLSVTMYHAKLIFPHHRILKRQFAFGKFSEDEILKLFSYFSQKTGFDIPCKLSPLETICMECQILFSRKSKKNMINLLSAEFA